MPRKKKEENLKTLLVFVQDETGSMASQEKQAVSAFDEYFDTLKKEVPNPENVDCQIWQFSECSPEDRVRSFYKGNLAGVPSVKDTYRPRGITPLLDAVGTGLQQASGKKYDRYLFVVQTDGLENASKDFTREQVQKLVTEKEALDNWTLVFLGAGISQWMNEATAQFSAPDHSIAPFGVGQYRKAYGSLAINTATLLGTDNKSDKALGSKVKKDLES